MILNISAHTIDKISTLVIYTANGEKILTEQLNTNQHKINVTSFSKGTYLLRIFNDTKSLTSKFVKK